MGQRGKNWIMFLLEFFVTDLLATPMNGVCVRRGNWCRQLLCLSPRSRVQVLGSNPPPPPRDPPPLNSTCFGVRVALHWSMKEGTKSVGEQSTQLLSGAAACSKLDLTNTNANTDNKILRATTALDLARIPNGSEVALLLGSFPSQGPIKTDTVRLGCSPDMVSKSAEGRPSSWFRLPEACPR